MAEELILNKIQRDALQELCNIGMGHATTALARLLNQTILFDVPRVQRIKISRVPAMVGGKDEMVVGIYMRFQGPVQGNILIMFPRQSVLVLQEIITGEKKTEIILNEYFTSMLKEIGNILAGSYLSVMETLLGMRLIQSVPLFAFDLARAVIDPILAQVGEEKDYTLLTEAVFHLKDSPQLTGKFFLIPDPKSVRLMLESVGLAEN